MGNIAFNSFPKNMSDKDFTEALESICQDRFDGLVKVTENYHEGELCSWTIGPDEAVIGDENGRYEWEIYRKSKRKFGGKHPHGDWGSWLMTIVQNELASRYNGRISDEGVPGTWKGNTAKYRTFLEYMKSMNSFLYKNHQPSFQSIYELTPEILRNDITILNAINK